MDDFEFDVWTARVIQSVIELNKHNPVARQTIAMILSNDDISNYTKLITMKSCIVIDMPLELSAYWSRLMIEYILSKWD